MAVGALVAVLAALSQAAGAQPRPNIVFIMADDLGNADLGYRGGEVKTPNIDKLATEGAATGAAGAGVAAGAASAAGDSGGVLLAQPARQSAARIRVRWCDR
jgi:hypothetical protein